MTPLKNKIIVEADINQKEMLIYGSLKLIIPKRAKLNQDGKQSQPTLCKVVASNEPDINEGDILILGHTSLMNTAQRISLVDSTLTVSIEVSKWVSGKIEVNKWILGKLDDKGQFIPLCGNVLAKRLMQPAASSIIITPDAYKKTEENKILVLATSKEVKNLFAGQTALIHKHSDYEIFYSWQGEDRSSIVIWDKNIVGVLKEVA